MSFYHDRDNRGRPLEEALVVAFQHHGFTAGLNPAPEPTTEEEYRARCAYDIWTEINGEPVYFEVKMDWLALATGNLCIEKPNPYSIADYYIHCWLQGIQVFSRTEREQLFAAYPKKYVGDNKQVYAAIGRIYHITQSSGIPFWKFQKEAKINQYEHAGSQAAHRIAGIAVPPA